MTKDFLHWSQRNEDGANEQLSKASERFPQLQAPSHLHFGYKTGLGELFMSRSLDLIDLWLPLDKYVARKNREWKFSLSFNIHKCKENQTSESVCMLDWVFHHFQMSCVLHYYFSIKFNIGLTFTFTCFPLIQIPKPMYQIDFFSV